jgi:hypothetical protein
VLGPFVVVEVGRSVAHRDQPLVHRQHVDLGDLEVGDVREVRAGQRGHRADRHDDPGDRGPVGVPGDRLVGEVLEGQRPGGYRDGVSGHQGDRERHLARVLSPGQAQESSDRSEHRCYRTFCGCAASRESNRSAWRVNIAA